MAPTKLRPLGALVPKLQKRGETHLHSVLADTQGVPEFDGFVPGTGDDLAVVRRESHTQHIFGVTHEAPGGGAPERENSHTSLQPCIMQERKTSQVKALFLFHLLPTPHRAMRLQQTQFQGIWGVGGGRKETLGVVEWAS